MQKEKRLVPSLRFSEFEGEWEKKCLGSISKNIGYGMNAAAKTFDGINKYIRITDIDERTRQFTPNPLTSPEGIIDEKYVLQEGDILFARTGASVGKSYLYNKNDGRLLFAGFLIKFHISAAIPYFIFLQTFQERYNKWVQVYSMRSGQPGLNAKEYKDFEFYLSQIEEQQKIANFLTAVDTRLQTLANKKSLLEEYKKGVMQQIFKQKLRFKDEDGKDFPEWEKKKLGDVSSKKSSNIAANKIEENFGDYIIYGASGVLKKVDFYEEENDYISIVKDGAGVGRIFYCKGKTSVLGTMEIIKPKKGLNTYFLYCLLEGINFKKYITGSTIPHIYYKDYKKENIGVPCLEEQTKIANFLSAIDKKIRLVEEKIEKTKTYKKGLLQQMFV